jgi:hypothetical protein
MFTVFLLNLSTILAKNSSSRRHVDKLRGRDPFFGERDVDEWIPAYADK